MGVRMKNVFNEGSSQALRVSSWVINSSYIFSPGLTPIGVGEGDGTTPPYLLVKDRHDGDDVDSRISGDKKV
ncbi:MAG: hypothetical protein JRJ85_19655 [Deltaproteobacteria bacterium]|nr:hypothetical protein [Deltaproteobacteria bacterium]